VIVRFLEGDPDRPLITGRVYHELNMPPYELPEHKTRTVFKSMSTPGEEGEPRGYNELRIKDKKDNEEIYVHAQKDVNIYVKNDWKEHILHDKHETIDASRYTHIKGEEHLLIEKDRKTELKEKDHFTVHNDSHSEYKTKWLVKAGEEIHFKSGDKIVFAAGSDMTIKGGDSFIRLTPAGIVILGSQVKINEGGSPGSGTGAAPELPDEATTPGEAPKPKRTKLELKDGKEKEEVNAGESGEGGNGDPERDAMESTAACLNNAANDNVAFVKA
jgi:type VI secretion system secreted protein VgrG